MHIQTEKELNSTKKRLEKSRKMGLLLLTFRAKMGPPLCDKGSFDYVSADGTGFPSLLVDPKIVLKMTALVGSVETGPVVGDPFL